MIEYQLNKWTNWQPIPSPEECRNIKAPRGPGIYQIRHYSNKEKILFGIGIKCQKRMRSLFPKPFGIGTRNNESKRNYILKNWKDLEYRTMATVSRDDAKEIEDQIKLQSNHKFNT